MQDAEAFAAGERAALARAFQAALPGQQALGRLAAAAEAQGAGLAEESARVRALQSESAELRATVQVPPPFPRPRLAVKFLKDLLSCSNRGIVHLRHFLASCHSAAWPLLLQQPSPCS